MPDDRRLWEQNHGDVIVSLTFQLLVFGAGDRQRLQVLASPI